MIEYRILIFPLQKPDIDHIDPILDDYSKYPEYDAKDDFGKNPLLDVFVEEPTTKSEFQKKSFDLEPQPESPQVLNLFPYKVKFDALLFKNKSLEELFVESFFSQSKT